MIRRLIILLLILGCEDSTSPKPEDCAGIVGGTASIDDCGTCTGGTTGLEVNYLMDCADTCNGNAVEDECGVCGGDGIADGACDCDGNVLDVCYICGGTCIECADCDDSECCDCDGNVYQTVQIGEQLWMAENLKVTRYNDGSEIPYPSNEDWSSYDEGQYGVYANDPSNADIYGNLYNWAVVGDERGVCPEGFHVPTDEEWIQLTDFLGGINNLGSIVAGGKMKEAGLEHWNSPNKGATNESGFTGLPGGFRFAISGSYGWLGSIGYFWSSSESSSSTAWYRDLFALAYDVWRDSGNKQNGFSIRCLKD